jgi:putative transposase
MPRIARVIAPGIPHHVVQRGNRWQNVFFREDDYRTYRSGLADWCLKSGVQIWAYCLMPNHVHLIAVPSTETGMRFGIGEAHKGFSRMINAREGWKGHLWQGRFFSCPLDENFLLVTARHVETNPVRSGLASSPENYLWSSARAHFDGRNDGLVTVRPLLDRVGDWPSFLQRPLSADETRAVKRHEKTGRPLGSDAFILNLENQLRRVLRPGKSGPKPRRQPSPEETRFNGLPS